MKQVSNFSPDVQVAQEPDLPVQGILSSRLYNIRPCPSCGEHIFGMPGGRDAHCHVCGFKDPCCSD